MLLLLGFLVVVSFHHLANAATCDTITTFGSSWGTGQDGTFNLVVPASTSSWTIVVTFDNPVTLNTWNGILVGCVGGTVCTFNNEFYNGHQTQGDKLNLGYQILFPSTSTLPKATSLVFNGATMCSNGPVVAITTQSPGGALACAHLFYDFSYQWTGGANGNFYIKFSSAVSRWKVTVQFDSNVNGLSVWNGAQISCSGSICSFRDAGYNANQPQGQSLTLGFQVQFNGSPAPNVIAISIGTKVLCSGLGSGGTTLAPVTPTSTATISSTSGPTTTTISTTQRPSTNTSAATGRCADYSSLINLSMLFYEAQRSGKLPANQRVTWRKDSALNDKGTNGEDLTGGYYDAGDFMKFGFPMAYTITVLAWGGVAYPQGYTNSGQFNYLLDAVKWGTDYFIKAHVSPDVFYAQVGDPNADHSYWGRPEDMTMPRPAQALSPSKPGSDLLGETAAAMAAASILFNSTDPAYSATLLSHAKQLFTLADTYRGTYANSINNNGEVFYSSENGFKDELLWAALWLYKATGTQSYLNYATTGYSTYAFTYNTEVLSWDSKHAGVKILLAQITGQTSYFRDVLKLCDYLVNDAVKSPLGEVFLGEWGSLRSAANAAWICLLASDLNIAAGQKTSYQAFAVDQMEYILQKTGRSFVVGFGANSPTHPHHRSSSCPDAPAVCSFDTLRDTSVPNYHLLTGALVGGPRAADDQYTDVRTDYVGNEVATDYNAAYQSLLAGLKQKTCL